MPALPSGWSSFRRRDLSAAIRLVSLVAASGDPGAHGHGVEVVLESPHHRWWRRFFDRTERDQARIAVTGAGGATGYPLHVRLVTGYGHRAAGKIDRRDNWATGVTTMKLRPGSLLTMPHPHEAGEAFIVLKRGTGIGFDPDDAAAEVVAGTVAALADLHPFSPDRGWRARIDRHILRH